MLSEEEYGILTIMSIHLKYPGPYLGSRMRIAGQWGLDEAHHRVLTAGFDDVSRAHMAVFRYPMPDGYRPTALADAMRITKQSVNDLLRDLEKGGYLTREPDPTDGRARVIRLTDRGNALRAVIGEAAFDGERAIAELLGPERFQCVRDALFDLVDHILTHGLSIDSIAKRAD